MHISRAQAHQALLPTCLEVAARQESIPRSRGRRSGARPDRQAHQAHQAHQDLQAVGVVLHLACYFDPGVRVRKSLLPQRPQRQGARGPSDRASGFQTILRLFVYGKRGQKGHAQEKEKHRTPDTT